MTRTTNKIKAFTVIEVLVALVILSLLLLMIVPIFSYSRSTVKTMNRLDVFHDTRKISHEINSTLKLTTEVLYPDPSVKRGWRNYMVFRSPFNQVYIFYVNDKDSLIVINYDKIRNGKVVSGKTLARNVKEFSVRRPESNLIEYRVRLEAENSKEIEFSGMVNLANLI